MISDKIASGCYHSASEVVREALRLLERQEEVYQARLEQLCKELTLGSSNSTGLSAAVYANDS